MPEGDTIWRMAALLHAGLEGKRVLRARPDSLKRFEGRSITEVKPVGKHLLIRFDNGLAIHSHMRMQGAWHLYRRSEPWRRPDWQVKAVIETEDAVAVCFSAPLIEIVRDEGATLGHLGPDILDAGWSVREVVERARSIGPAPIGELLLDQRVTAGIGNVYRCEALWQCRVNPWTHVAEIDDDQLTVLFETAHRAMRANIDGGIGRRFPGYGRGAVHGRGGRPCPRCGARISVRAQGELARLTYWCPACQPAPLRTAAAGPPPAPPGRSPQPARPARAGAAAGPPPPGPRPRRAP
jgi:endonuclease-8